MNIACGNHPETSGEAALLELLGERNWGTIIDCGANEGAWSRAATRYLNPRRIVAFEPNRTIKFDCPRADIKRFGLSDATGYFDFYLPTDGGVGLGSIHPDPLRTQKAGQIFVQPLREWMKDSGTPAVDYLKIDVEGHEAAVLRGAPIAEIPYIQFEYSGVGSTLRECYELLAPTHDVYRILRNGTLVRIQYEPIYEIPGATNYIAIRRMTA